MWYKLNFNFITKVILISMIFDWYLFTVKRVALIATNVSKISERYKITEPRNGRLRSYIMIAIF